MRTAIEGDRIGDFTWQATAP